MSNFVKKLSKEDVNKAFYNAMEDIGYENLFKMSKRFKSDLLNIIESKNNANKYGSLVVGVIHPTKMDVKKKIVDSKINSVMDYLKDANINNVILKNLVLETDERLELVADRIREEWEYPKSIDEKDNYHTIYFVDYGKTYEKLHVVSSKSMYISINKNYLDDLFKKVCKELNLTEFEINLLRNTVKDDILESYCVDEGNIWEYDTLWDEYDISNIVDTTWEVVSRNCSDITLGKFDEIMKKAHKYDAISKILEN